jgi:hypothetical protein
MKKQIIISALVGVLVAAGMMWERPTYGATPDVQVAFSPDGGGEHLVLWSTPSGSYPAPILVAAPAR